ncbi:MAG TPA: NADH-quinone oxidoreductase subunit NuoG [Patescibacteria group bacterium]|nr:NADH-quinone oxidoreductase subunit NuoG [Patescibacteria group bacterium]
MPKLTIDGMEVTVEPGTSIIQAAEQLGIEIPRFCYHDKLSVPANCRMCLVEVEKSPKPVASCAMPCAEDMKVMTNSPLAQKARKGVIEMLLINHPLDCPICDQGGECDLQDQTVAFGFDRSRYREEKRAVKDKDLGPLVKTIMTRCIHCTRCVRFGDEIAGVDEIGVLNRGEHLEIGTYVQQMVTSELSGNIIDICPVGALTSKPYEFTARPWELRKVESIDVSDAVGSNIRIDTRNGVVLRVLPRLHEGVNEEWISDKARFAIDGLKNQRLNSPYVRVNGKLVAATWGEAFDAIAQKMSGVDGKQVGAIAGDLADCEAMAALKDLLEAFGSKNLECRQDGSDYDVSQPAGWRFNSTIAGIEKSDAILLVGTNPRHEAAMVNARIRKTWLAKRIKIGLIGQQVKLNYPTKYLGAGPETLAELAAGKGAFAEVLSTAQNPMIILGPGAFGRDDGMAIHALARAVAEKFNMVKDGWNGFNVLHTQASRVGALELGFTGGDIDKMLKAEVLYLLGADDIPVGNIGAGTFVIYQGHHGDAAAARADVILPGAAYTEKNATYVNIEGRAQRAKQAVFPPGEAREDWKIIRALSEVLGKTLPYDDIAQLRARMAKENPVFSAIDTVQPAAWKPFGKEGKADTAPFSHVIENFYMTDVISRASRVMAECSEAFLNGVEKTGTHG